MAQSSGPISQGTTAERQFSDVQWRDLFGDEPGVISDLDGTAYALNLSGGGDVVNVGSTTQISTAKVAGFAHRIPQSSPEPITIPAASGSTRTDIIGLRYDPAYTGLPGPVRLFRTAGSSASIPVYDSSPPGVEDLPLWAITRAVGQALSLATVTRLFPRLAPVLELPTNVALPISSPLGTTVVQGSIRYRRQLVGGSPAWVIDTGSVPYFTSVSARNTAFPAPVAGDECKVSLAGTVVRQVYDGTGWRFTLYGKFGPVGTDGSAIFGISHGAGQTPLSWGVVPIAQATDTLTAKMHTIVWSQDSSLLNVRFAVDGAYYVGTVYGSWWAKF